MKTSTALCALAAMLPAVSANFDIYFGSTGGFVGGTTTGYIALPADDDVGCDEAGDANLIKDLSDVSGDKHGIRCEGAGCGYEEGEIKEMEIHTNDEHHYTIYGSRGMGLFTKKDEKVGDCKLYGDVDLECDVFGGIAGLHKSYSRVRCEKTHIVASDFD